MEPQRKSCVKFASSSWPPQKKNCHEILGCEKNLGNGVPEMGTTTHHLLFKMKN